MGRHMKSTNLCNFSYERGFTYLWTLALVAIMGLGIATTAEVYTTSRQRDKELELIFIGHEFRNAIERYYNASRAGGGHQYPASIEQLLRDDRFPEIRRYLRKVYLDPMTGKAEWGVVRVGAGIVGIYSTSDRKPIKVGNFELEDVDFEGSEKYSEWKFTYLTRESANETKATTLFSEEGSL